VNLQIERGALFQADRGQFLDADDQIALVHRWHESLANLGVDHTRPHQHRHRHADDDPLPTHAPGKRRLIKRQQLARQPWVFMLDLA